MPLSEREHTRLALHFFDRACALQEQLFCNENSPEKEDFLHDQCSYTIDAMQEHLIAIHLAKIDALIGVHD